ncbi:MAG: Asp-tRNA(Asn)/Glu-tRNA(Gln) amidotransferase subunit GatC [Patescibacteria group bacterium]|nr:Asp-tRNA(Asn)/Glu-tRNA(Gln) amidotransferase subunit GatC [bacterium]MDZ4240897.1 Asp-tRNA(Asn)/Glu-tRNA(Gln) amidotransferase subunit GatC [Patescibacteria group bacterium]
MITKEEVKKLAGLSRMKVSDEEVEQFAKEIDSILGYVEQIKNVVSSLDDKKSSSDNMLKNVMREDENPHESGAYTKEIVAEFPEKGDNNELKVKNIL